MEESYPIPLLRYFPETQEFRFYCGRGDDHLPRNIGFEWKKWGWYTRKLKRARRLMAFGDMRTREILYGLLNRYDPFFPNPLPNDLLPQL